MIEGSNALYITPLLIIFTPSFPPVGVQGLWMVPHYFLCHNSPLPPLPWRVPRATFLPLEGIAVGPEGRTFLFETDN